MFKKIVFGFCSFAFLLGTYSTTSAIVVEIPRDLGNPDVAVTGPEQITGDESSIFETLQLINKYLWFSIGAVCMGVLVWWGIQLITANGNADKMKKTSKLLMWVLVGILISILSYSIIRLVINLFQ